MRRLVLFSIAILIALSNPASSRVFRGTLGPPASANIVADWSADSLALSNGANVTSWTDKVGGSVAGTQVGTLPTFATNQVNGKPAVVCGGAGGLSVASPSAALNSALTSSAYTVFIVFKNTGSATQGVLLAATNIGTSTSISYWADGSFLGTETGQGNTAYIPDAAQTNFTTLGAVYGSGLPVGINSWFQNVNGGTVLSTNSTPAALSGNLGICADPGNGFPGKNQIFEILVWNVALTPAQYLQAEMWARTKYGQAYPWLSSPIHYFPVGYGDSIMAGNQSGLGTSGAGSATVNSPCYLMAQTLGLSYGQWSCPSFPSISLNNLGVLAPTIIDPIPATIGMKVADITFEWANQTDTTTTAGAAYLASRKAVSNMFTVWGTSTDERADQSNRALYDAAWDAATKTNIDAYMAIHTDTHIGVNGSYVTYTDGACAGADGLHLCSVTYPYLAALFSSGISALP